MATNTKAFAPSIGLWSKQNGHSFTKKDGLTKEQVQFLQSLKEGDGLVLFKSDEEEGSKRPTFVLKKSIPKTNSDL